jgi:hypothetical protein
VLSVCRHSCSSAFHTLPNNLISCDTTLIPVASICWFLVREGQKSTAYILKAFSTPLNIVVHLGGMMCLMKIEGKQTYSLCWTVHSHLCMYMYIHTIYQSRRIIPCSGWLTPFICHCSFLLSLHYQDLSWHWTTLLCVVQNWSGQQGRFRCFLYE